MLLLFKIGLVWTFATQSEYAIGIAQKFFIDFAKEGSGMVWDAVSGTSGTTDAPTGKITAVDSKIDEATNFASNSAGNSFASDMDPVCKKAMMSLVFFLFLTMPVLFLIALIYIYSLIRLFATALLFYFKSIILISFLIMLAPIFVSFALFKRTSELFETWVKLLATNALQMLIMFAFFAMITLIDFGSFFQELFNLFRVYRPLGNGLLNAAVGAANKVTSFFSLGVFTIQTEFCSLCYYNITNNYQNITCIGNTAMPITALPFQINFFIWVITKVVSLMLLSYLLEDFLKKSPRIAEQLGGTRFGGILSGSGSAPGFVGYSNPLFRTIESRALAFKNAYRQSMYRPGVGSALGSLGYKIQNPLNLVRNVKSLAKATGVGLGLSSETVGIDSWEAEKIRRRLKDYEKRAIDAKKSTLRTGRILANTLKQHKDGKVNRATLMSVQTAHNLALKNAERWQKKIYEAANELKTENERSKEGASTTAYKEASHIINQDYQRLIGSKLQDAKTKKSFYFIPINSDYSEAQEEQDRLNLEAMQNYLQSQIEDVRKKVDSSGANLSDYEKGRINQELNNAKSYTSSGTPEQVESAIDNLRSISNNFD